MARLPFRYQLRLTLADGSPRTFTTYAFNKLDAYGQAAHDARRELGDDAYRAATVYGCERVS